MKFLIILCILVLFTGCAAEREEQVSMVTDNLTEIQVHISDETVVPPTISCAGERELFTPLINPQNDDFVRVSDHIPGIHTELKYATSDNFTGQTIYGFQEVFLRYGTVIKLKAVAEELEGQGYGLKIWDGFRPVSAQFKLWDICPDDTYVADPNKGYSNHSRGFAVDLTLVDSQGREVVMPTAYDDFSEKADRDYSDCSQDAAENARLLERVMEKHGFSGYRGEWWHFNDTEKYDVETCFDPGLICWKTAQKDSPLLRLFYDSGTDILTIPAGEQVTFLGFREEYSLVEYWGYRGYVLTEYLQ